MELGTSGGSATDQGEDKTIITHPYSMSKMSLEKEEEQYESLCPQVIEMINNFERWDQLLSLTMDSEASKSNRISSKRSSVFVPTPRIGSRRFSGTIQTRMDSFQPKLAAMPEVDNCSEQKQLMKDEAKAIMLSFLSNKLTTETKKSAVRKWGSSSMVHKKRTNDSLGDATGGRTQVRRAKSMVTEKEMKAMRLELDKMALPIFKRVEEKISEKPELIEKIVEKTPMFAELQKRRMSRDIRKPPPLNIGRRSSVMKETILSPIGAVVAQLDEIGNDIFRNNPKLLSDSFELIEGMISFEGLKYDTFAKTAKETIMSSLEGTQLTSVAFVCCLLKEMLWKRKFSEKQIESVLDCASNFVTDYAPDWIRNHIFYMHMDQDVLDELEEEEEEEEEDYDQHLDTIKEHPDDDQSESSNASRPGWTKFIVGGFTGMAVGMGFLINYLKH